LSAADEAAIDEDLAQAEAALKPLAPDGLIRGFRAPGYNVSPALMRVLVRRGYLYDSSLLPAPAYWMARAAAIARYAIRKKPSASMIGRAAQFAGPLHPYRCGPDRPWRPVHDGPLVELPMAVHPSTRMPIIGTSWVLMPDWMKKWWLRSALQRLDVFNFEMHAIDLLDPTDPGVPAGLDAHQPDLNVSATSKFSMFRTLFRRIAHERDVAPLAHIASVC
ncbi:MAG: polysaccharide deacetylase, partial [Myxococcota bacterium]